MAGRRATAVRVDPRVGDVAAEYLRLGHHRTGGPGDLATSQWLVARLRAAGLGAERQSFDFPVFEPGLASVSVEGRTIEGAPMWPPRTTALGGVAAELTLASRPGMITVLRLIAAPGADIAHPSHVAALSAAMAGGPMAVVAVTECPDGGLLAFDVPAGAEPAQAPILLVAGREGAALFAAARGGKRGRVRITGAQTTRAIYNVVARRPGPEGTVVISAPRSGWETDAEQRAGGLALWTRLVETLSARTRHNLIAAATSGSELGAQGAERFLAHGANRFDDVRAWLHIGDEASGEADLYRRTGHRPLVIPPDAKVDAVMRGLQEVLNRG